MLCAKNWGCFVGFKWKWHLVLYQVYIDVDMSFVNTCEKNTCFCLLSNLLYLLSVFSLLQAELIDERYTLKPAALI